MTENNLRIPPIKPSSTSTISNLLRTKSSVRAFAENPNRRINDLFANAEIEGLRLEHKSRARIAFWFTVAFIVISIIIIVGTPVYNYLVPVEKNINISSLLSSFGSLFGTSLGFVLGYYFKDKK